MPQLKETITSRRNPLVRQLRLLHRPAGRREQGLLLLEGTHLLQETLRLGLLPERVLASTAWIQEHSGLLARLPASVPVHPASGAVIEAAATTRHPDGIVLTLGIGSLPGSPPDAGGRSAGTAFILVLDRLQDPGNMGTLLRTALAAGVQQVWLLEGADPLQPKVLRASSGAALALPQFRMDGDLLRRRLFQAREEGLQLVAAVPAGGVVASGEGGAGVRPYWELDWCRPTVLLMGNEGAGLAADLSAIADHRVTVPHDPAVESLNVAAAASPLLLERWRRNRTAAG